MLFRSNDYRGIHLSLYWGSTDGGADSSAWENQMNIGNYFGTKMVPGLLAHGYNSQFSDSVEDLLDMTPAGVSIIMGEPTDPSANGMYFNHINDFKGAGMGITGSQFTALFTTTLIP